MRLSLTADSPNEATGPTASAGTASAPVSGRARRQFRKSLTARLLAVAGCFVVLTEAAVFVPALAEFRNRWMAERFDTGELVVLAWPGVRMGGAASDPGPALLEAAQITGVSLLSETGARQTLVGAPPPAEAHVVDLERETLGASIADSLRTLFGSRGGSFVIIGRPRANAALKMEVTVSAEPLRRALAREARELLGWSLTLTALIGALIYASLIDGFVRPMKRLTSAISRFRRAPEDATQVLRPSGRADEIGEAEEAFADMQDALRQSLLQRERLAQLGVAVSKIAHDLRHSLGSAQLVSERLATVDDPVVKATAPRLERALERAVGLAESTLRFGKADERMPQPEPLDMAAFLDEVAEDALMGRDGCVWINDVTPDVFASADREQARRVFDNLIRNAAQAMLARGEAGHRLEVRATAQEAGELIGIEIADTGPGIPQRVRDRLFEPFAGTGHSGGTGLGLAIARDLARLNGGDLRLIATGQEGTRFEVRLRRANRD